eukprot:TRINITY_DN42495_c0_g2_i1.p1 TRINITY_DN42495_c0_g2~~TRINITY_DN42495_c0_g2_i1.p1  ORF type:complete len:384 (+),score=43.40 TRINITY_DN42495_c0_g2_i1:134-1153(+)
MVASVPNSGSTWIVSALELAHNSHVGVAGIFSDTLHPDCNAFAATELALIAGAPEAHSFPHIFRSAPLAGLELLMEMLTDQMHSASIYDVQFYRKHSVTVSGDKIPEHLRWVDGIPPRTADRLSMGMIFTKEVINAPLLAQSVVHHHAILKRHPMIVMGLYRHRAHSFPVANSTNLCKNCMFTRIVMSFEKANFRKDPPLAGLQKWWHFHGPSLGGADSTAGVVFGHLVSWYVLLRTKSIAAHVLDYAQLMLLDRPELRTYLNATLPTPVRRVTGVIAVAASIDALRMKNGLSFLQQREERYAKLGVESAARAVIAEMRRLDPDADLTLLEQAPRGTSS